MNFATEDLTFDQTNDLLKSLMVQMGINDPVEVTRRINAGEWMVTGVNETIHPKGDDIVFKTSLFLKYRGFPAKKLTHGQINALLKSLMVQMGINDPVEVTRRINAGEWIVLPVLPTWIQVTVGTLGDVATALQRLKVAEIDIRSQLPLMKHDSSVASVVEYIFERVPFEGTEAALDIVCASGRDLGLIKASSPAEVYAAAKCHGLSICPPETAVTLGESLPSGGCLNIAMEPIGDPDGFPCVFQLFPKERVLQTTYADHKQHTDHDWVFVRDR